MNNILTKLFITLLLTIVYKYPVQATPINSFIDNLSPAINSRNASTSGNIVIYFSQSMNPATLNASGIKIFGRETGNMTSVISYDAVAKTATINPDENFKKGELINVILNSTIETSAGVPIDPFSYLFTVAISRGSGYFTAQDISQDGIKPDDIISGDFDNDGAIDLITLNKLNHKISFFRNDGSGNFVLNNTFEIVDPVELQCFTAADYDGDGDLDLVFTIAVYFHAELQVYLNNGDGTFIPGFRSWYPHGRIVTTIMKSADIDNDGDIDLIASSNDMHSGYLTKLINDGSAVFSPGGLVFPEICIEGCTSVNAYIADFIVDDFNNDGNTDIMLTTFQSVIFCTTTGTCQEIQIMTNDGNGTFTYHAGYSFSRFIACAGDFDNDGYTDVIGHTNSLRNNGDGSFTSFSTSIEGKCVTGDFDSDGYLDVAALGTNNVLLYNNNGDATFSPPVTFSTGNEPIALCAGDFDGDCDLDIATANHGSNNVSALYNSGDNNSLNGPELVVIGETSVHYSTSAAGGYWEIINTPPCNAVINGSNSNMSVYIDAGLSIGSFVLYYHSSDDCGWTSPSLAVSVDNPLPAELSSFTSSVNNSEVVLIWTTSSEINNSGFDIERSKLKDQTSDVWNKIAFINGHGTTTSPNNYEFTDRNLSSGKYNYRLKQIDFNGNYEYFNLTEEVMIGVPDKFDLSQNYPNPFNPVTNLEFGISDLEFVSLKVYDAMGKEVAELVNEIKPAGRYQVTFNGSNYASGVYFYKIVAGSFSAVKRMILTK